ncbi:MAG: hypothetical protein CBB68_05450 [Rhodospirillaceae bacterium TMED8]|nr:N,N-dimethylformamidase large subunit [Magnetovibrio sp.]OUT51441.1 MAG: hypothetical protein CBB68_05450 [Rhodospirillaceae bacterium TMED8]
MIPLIGYTNKLSARPGELIEVKVSSSAEEAYYASLVRVICADPNPAGPGIQTAHVESDFEGYYPSRQQVVSLGSYMRSELAGELPDCILVKSLIWPTTPEKGLQGVISCFDAETKSGFSVGIGPDGAHASCDNVRVTTEIKLEKRAWYEIIAFFDTVSGIIRISQKRLLSVGNPAAMNDSDGSAEAKLPKNKILNSGKPILVAAIEEGSSDTLFNGKIEAPMIFSGNGVTGSTSLLCSWDFSKNMTGFTVPGFGSLAGMGELIGSPTRGVIGANWNGQEMRWGHAPEQYGAIYFHDDDIADAGWKTDFSFKVPLGLRSGVYAIKLTQDKNWDMFPIFICPPLEEQTADFCVVMSTFTYVIYANQARDDFGEHWRARARNWGAFPHNPNDYPEFGLSTYNDHTDGSGISQTTWHRPILNMRVGYHVFGDDRSQSGLRHFPADTHFLAWLEAKNISYDIVTDWEVHHEGAALLSRYKAVATGTHPEYHSEESLNAYFNYRDNGGKLIYLGGNGFYWRVALHKEMDGLIEIRRAEGGLRAWASEPGEYYNSFDGEYGGTWRRNARPPQQLIGVGFTVQGHFEGTYYRRQSASYELDTAWIFEGVDDEIIGNFGLSGGGAAGYELDRVDPMLGSPLGLKILAVSENHPDHFVLPPEEWLNHVVTWSKEPPEKLIRSDMTYFDCPDGGAVFSVGSITFCGSLPTNNFDNNISRIIENVVRRFTN